MASLAVTNTLVAGSTITAAAHNTNYSDIVNYINARNSGGTKWEGLSTSGALAIDGNSTLTGTLSVYGLTTHLGNLTLDKTAPILTINSATSNPSICYFNINSTTKALFGVAGATDDLITGTAAGDFYFRTQGGKIVWCTDSGATIKMSFDSSGIATFSGQLIGKGTATNDNAATGYIGEVVSSSVASLGSMGSSDTFANITNISLTAGDWEISGQTIFYPNSGSLSGEWSSAISINSANTTTDHVDGKNVLLNTVPSGNTKSNVSIVYRLSLASPTTVYLKGKVTYSGNTPQYLGTIHARRLR